MLTEHQLAQIAKLRSKAILAAAGGVIATIVLGLATGLFEHNEHVHLFDKVFQGFIIAFIYWLALSVGCLALVMVHHLCGGAWSFVIQRINEAGSRTLPLFAVLGAIIILGAVYLTHVYPWTDPEYIREHPVVANKTLFLNLGTFTLASAGYFAIWIVLMLVFNRCSRNLDKTGNPQNIFWQTHVAGPGLILYVLTMTLASTHWAMSIEPIWFSTIYGGWIIAGYNMSVVAFSVIVLSYLSAEGPLSKLVTERHYYHLGNLLLGFTIFWTYISFGQFLIIWNADMPEEIGWYLHRSSNSLNIITVFLMIFHWFIPMMLLLMRKNKMTVRTFRKICYYVLIVRTIDIYWNIAPGFVDNHNVINFGTLICSIAAVIGIGGIWLWAFLGQLTKLPIVPQQDPRIELNFLRDEAHSHA